MAGLAYYAPYDKDASYYKVKVKNKNKKYQTYNLQTFMQYTGFKDVNRSYLGQKYKDNHIVQFNYGYKPLKKGNTTKYLVPIVIRGTSGSKEWLSNFTIGKDGPHKGFNTAASRVVQEIETYLSKHKINAKNAIIWITGHSRGGGVCNLAAKKMIDKKYNVFAYTFAAPAVTQTSHKNKAKYRHIYNIINEQDFVPRLPLSKWGFDLYGSTRKKSLTKKQQESFKNRVDESYSALNNKDMTKLVKSLEAVAATRADCFKYTCACHSSNKKKTGKSITISNLFKTEYLAEYGLSHYKKTLSKEQISACKFEIVLGKIGGVKYTVCQSPMFFMYTLADTMSGLWNGPKFVFVDVAIKYKSAKWLLIKNSLNIQKPHYVDSYIMLT